MAMLGCSLQSSTADAISSILLTLQDTDTLTQPLNRTKNSTRKIPVYEAKVLPLVCDRDIFICYLLLL